ASSAEGGAISEWIFQDGQFFGMDQASGIVFVFEGSQAGQLWRQAASPVCGGGLEGGASNVSARKLSNEPHEVRKGRQLAEVLADIAVK
ncbi:unnamed protein product, partial [Prorocentrum cordatum]